MPNEMSKVDLVERLNAALAGTGCSVREGEQGCILVERKGFLRGVWHCADGAFAWIPGGYSKPTLVFKNADAVVEYMRQRTA